MQQLMFLLFLAIFFLDYLAHFLGVISPKLTLVPEMLSAIVAILVFFEFLKTKNLAIDGKYLIFFLLFALHIVNGIIINGSSSGAVIAGMRIYMKYIPFFFLPIVFNFSETQIRTQLHWLLSLAIFQFPVAMLQRFVLFKDVQSGDVVRGTLYTSSFLSIILMCAITMVLAFYLKKRISLNTFLLLLLVLFLPATLNETKGTVFLLAIAFFVPVIVKRRRAGEKSKVLPVFIIVGILYGTFATVYDHMVEETIQRDRPTIVEFFTDPDKIKHYLAPRSFGMVKDSDGPIGRIDRIIYPLMTLSDDPVKLLVGLGMGSVTQSPIGKLSGDYVKYRDERMVGGSVSYLLWETGVLGVLLSGAFLFLVFRDSRNLSRQEDQAGAIGLGWAGVVSLIGASLFYKDIMPVNVIMYLFWYFSGYVVATHVRIKWKAQRSQPFKGEAEVLA